MIVAPTAAGKSFLIAEVARGWKEPILVLQPSKELLEQNYNKFIDQGGEATIFSASAGKKEISHVTYATLGSVKKAIDLLKFYGVKTILVDECHYKFSEAKNSEFMLFIEQLKPTKVLGFTATPVKLVSTMEGSELKMLNRIWPRSYFKYFVDVIQIQTLVELGFWSKIKYEVHQFDETNLKMNTSASEYTDISIKQEVKAQKVNNRIYKRIQELQAEGVNSILVFVDSVENAQVFSQLSGIDSPTWVHGQMNKKDRDENVSGFKSGKYKVMFNFGVLSVGFDYPDLRCVINGRPTMSLSDYYQKIGRGTRISKETGKEFFLYIDYCGNVHRFGKVENLTIEHLEGWGWGMFNGDYALTNVPMKAVKMTKQDLLRKVAKKQNKFFDARLPECANSSVRIWFGKHQGKLVTEAPIHWLEWMVSDKNPMTFSGTQMQALYKEIKRVLQKDLESKQMLLTLKTD